MMQQPNERVVETPVNGLSIRDMKSKALLNTDANSLMEYKFRKQKMDAMREKNNISASRIERIEHRQDSFEQSLNRIEGLLRQLLGNVNGSTIS